MATYTSPLSGQTSAESNFLQYTFAPAPSRFRIEKLPSGKWQLTDRWHSVESELDSWEEAMRCVQSAVPSFSTTWTPTTATVGLNHPPNTFASLHSDGQAVS
jgi:hypothetical protein